MPRVRITKRFLDSLTPRDREFVHWDPDLAGFGVRVRPTGRMTYIVQYRAGSGRSAPDRKVTLAPVGRLTPDEARAEARRLLGSVAQGADPAGERQRRHAAMTINELAAAFMALHVKPKRKPKTAELYQHILEKFVLPALGAKSVADVTKADVMRLHHGMRDRPFMANRTLAVISSLFSWASKHEHVHEGLNPAARIETFVENRRERFLSTEELKRLGAALREAETVGIPWEPNLSKPTAKHLPKPENRQTIVNPFATAAIRLLLFTGARLREILHLRWAEVDLARGLLFLPDSKTGRKTIVLSAPAIAVLHELPRTGVFVIAGNSPDKPRSDLKRPWGLVSRRAKLEGVRIHDLRHSFASFGAGGGLGLPIIGKLLGHTQASTTQRYAHLDTDPLRRASDAIALAISAAMGEFASTDRNGSLDGR
ncbi:tyrosine-type recombinase/integrase [Antarcticirhabdus aurantiaca]|uniref:tyrosine-type recombinase/integrase n=1 Tax=Antarcticirhabdus aurantiaca TaxID=2606717 RepID=UPI00131A9B7D|nr:site-specific integrase [Antarcticirhabdus aurantiaca]